MTLIEKYNEAVIAIEVSTEYKEWLSEVKTLTKEPSSCVDLDSFSTYFLVSTYVNGANPEETHNDMEMLSLDY